MAYYNVGGRKLPYAMSAPRLSGGVSASKGPSNRFLEYGIFIAVVFLILILAYHKK